jgi:ankyrin repeat protein
LREVAVSNEKPTRPRAIADIRAGYALDSSDPRFTSIAARDADDDTLLHRAVFRGNRRDADDLLSLGADVNAHGDMGHTPLHYAAMEGHLNLVELLLAAGADPWAKNEWGHTPATTAELAGHKDVARLLLSPRRRQRAISG